MKNAKNSPHLVKKFTNLDLANLHFRYHKDIVNCLKNNADRKNYLPMQGLPELREAISKYLTKKTGVSYSKNNIIITPGSKEAMYLMHVAFDGDIILPAPSWVSYSPQAEIADNKVHWIQTSRDNNWFPTATELKKKIQGINKKN